MNQRLDALVRKVVFGSPPGAMAAEVDKLRFVRRLWARLFLILLVGFVLAAAEGSPTVIWVVLGVPTAALLVGSVKLWADLRRERRRPPGSAA